jgi:hypothetical protein
LTAPQLSPDEALAKLYALLKERNAPKPGSFATLDADGRRRYFTEARRRNRAKEKTAAAKGAPMPTLANVRDALADSALMMLATGAPGTEHIRACLGHIFEARPGVPTLIEARARSGEIRPKLVRVK